jgi:hypothetical protein
MTDTLQKQSLVLTIASLACAAAAFFVLWRHDVFSSGVEVIDQPVIAPANVVRLLVAACFVVVPQFVLAALRGLGCGKLWSRVSAFARNVESMPAKVNDIHQWLEPPAGPAAGPDARPKAGAGAKTGREEART